MLAATRCRPRIARVPQPLTILSRSLKILDNGFTSTPSKSDTAITPNGIIQNPQDGLYYINYGCWGTGGNQWGLLRSSSPDGPWTDLGPITGPTPVTIPQWRLLLTPDNKWSAYVESSASAGGVVQLWQTAAAAAINSTYTQTSSSLFAVGGAGTWNFTRNAEPFIFQTSSVTSLGASGTWAMLFMGANSGVTLEQVGIAVSSGDHTGPWVITGSSPVLTNTQPYDASICADPFVVFYNGTYYIFYATGVSGAAQGSGVNYQACATTTDFTTFTKVGIVFPASANPSAGDKMNSWAGSFWWPGKLANDATCALPTSVSQIYYTYSGRPRSAGNTGVAGQGYLAKIDAQSIFGGAIAGNPWTRVESSALNPSGGTWTNTSSARGYSHGDISFCATTGATKTLTWTGKRARIYINEANSFGIANILVDGVQVATFDSYIDANETNPAPMIAYDTGDMMHGTHTLAVVVSGNKNAASSGVTVSLDCAEWC